MALNLKRLESINQRDKDTVIGYSRQYSSREAITKHIPKSISYLCLLFYNEYDCFIKCGNGLVINENGDTVTCINQEYIKKPYIRNSIMALGSISIDTSGNDKKALSTIYSWTFKLMKQERCFKGIYFGLYDSSNDEWILYKQRDKFKVGMTFKMEFSLKRRSMEIYRNDEYIEKDIVKHIQEAFYTMAIVIEDKGTILKLVKFEKRPCV